MLVGSALYIDVLHPVAILSLTFTKWQCGCCFDTKSILKSHESLQKLPSLDLSEWPVTKVVLSRMKEQDGGKVYQWNELHNCASSVIESFKRQALADMKSLDEQMRNRFEWSDLDFLYWHRVGTILMTTNQKFKQHSLVLLRFSVVPWKLKQLISVQLLMNSMKLVNTYLWFREESYRKIWYQLYTSPDAMRWPNILQTAQLLFSLHQKLNAYFPHWKSSRMKEEQTFLVQLFMFWWK